MSEGNPKDAIDQYVTEQRDTQHIPGLSLAVVRGGHVIHTRGYGLANLELGVPATPDTVYQIGSITKQFTAVAVMMLVEEGKIGLDERITRYQDGLPAAWGDITVRHLLNHTSGIKNYTNLRDRLIRLAPGPITRRELIALVADAPLEFSPGERYAYNNTGYYLLGHIIERAGGQSYAEFLQTRIFVPLGMEATRVNDMKDIIPNRADGYGWEEGRWRNSNPISPTWLFSAGGLISTVLDLAAWDAALGSEALISKANWARMWTPTTLADGTQVNYGFGWSVDDYHGHRTVAHGGGLPGFITFAERFAENDLAAIVLTNSAPSNPTEIARGVAGLYVPALLPARLMTPEPDPNPQQTADLKGVLEARANGLDSPRLSNGYRLRLSNVTADERAQLTEWVTGMTKFSFVAERAIPGVERQGAIAKTIWFYEMVTGDTTRYWAFYLTEDGTVTSMAVE